MNDATIAAISSFVTDLELHFRPHKHPTPESRRAWLKAITDALKGSSPQVLDRAKRRIIENRANQYFPLVADIRKACREAADEIQFDKHVATLPALRAATSSEWSTERFKLAYDLIKCAMGREAAQQGWVLALWNFCRDNQRLPEGKEIEACKREAREFDESFEACIRGNGGLASAALVNLGASMLTKRQRLADEVLGR